MELFGLPAGQTAYGRDYRFVRDPVLFVVHLTVDAALGPDPGGVFGPFVGIYYAHHEVAADDVVALELHEGDALDAGELPSGVLETARLPLRQVRLGGVPRYDHLG